MFPVFVTEPVYIKLVDVIDEFSIVVLPTKPWSPTPTLKMTLLVVATA